MNKRAAKTIKYWALITVVLVILYNSVYFQKLSDVRAMEASKVFDPKGYAIEFWNAKLPGRLTKAVSLDELTALLGNNPDSAFNLYSNALGIGSIRYFLVSGSGVVSSINEDEVRITMKNQEGRTITIATEFIFGNAIRDASGLVDINEFNNSMDFNNVSAEINTIIRTSVLPPFKQTVISGSNVEFTGAIELNKDHLNLSAIEIIPIKLNVAR